MIAAEPSHNIRMRMSVLTQACSHPRLHDARKFCRVPIGETNTAMRLRLTNGRWFGRAVNAVMLLGQADPDDPYRIVRPRLDVCFRILLIGVPEQIEVVVKHRVPERF